MTIWHKPFKSAGLKAVSPRNSLRKRLCRWSYRDHQALAGPVEWRLPQYLNSHRHRGLGMFPHWKRTSAHGLSYWIIEKAHPQMLCPKVFGKGLQNGGKSPSRAHCWNRPWQILYWGNRSGESSHRAPLLKTQRMPMITSRLSFQGLLPRLSVAAVLGRAGDDCLLPVVFDY
jgi:hypothetical protein